MLFSEKVDAVQKYLLQSSNSFLDIFILNSSLWKKLLTRKVAAVKNFVFSRNDCSVEVLLQEN